MMLRPKHNFQVGDIIKHRNYPQEEATIIRIDGNQLRVSHPYGWDWYQASECKLIEREFEF